MAISLDKIRKDAQKYIMKGTASDQVTISSPTGTNTVTTTGYNGKHWINFDSEGNSINSKSAHVGLSESDLNAKGYITRNADNEVYLFNHRITSKDSTGIRKTYVIKEWFPDETLGLIVCILGDYHV